MKRLFIVLIILLFCFLSKDALAERKYVPGRILIKVVPGAISMPSKSYSISAENASKVMATSLQTKNEAFKVKKIEKMFKTQKLAPGLKILGKKTVSIPDLSNYYVIEVPEDVSIESMVEEYKKDPNIEYVSPDYIRKIYVIPNDPLIKPYQPRKDNQWGLYKIYVPQAWDITTGSENVVIAVIDTGVNYNHQDLSGRVILGPDYVNNDNEYGIPTFGLGFNLPAGWIIDMASALKREADTYLLTITWKG